MAVTKTPRFSLPQWSAGSDKYPGRVGWNEILALLEGSAATNTPGAAVAIPSGPLAARPEGGTFGRFFLATDQGTPEIPMSRLYYDGGTGWVEINTNGGGGSGQPLAIGGSGAEGRSPRSARSDHTHPLPYATSKVPGAMSTAFAAMLEKATYGPPTPLTMPTRNWRGAIQVADPQDEQDSVNRRWLRAQYVPRVEHSAGNPNDPYMKRWDSGVGPRVYDPVHPLEVANKGYVDRRVSRRVWKENYRPLPYGLPEILSIDTGLFDYRDTEDTPLSMRGTKDVFGAYVEDFAEDLPMLVTHGEDGDPEGIKDRELIWVLVKAVQELAETNDELFQRNGELKAAVKTQDRKARAMESELAQIKHHLGLDA